jgi:hypothetical protein
MMLIYLCFSHTPSYWNARTVGLSACKIQTTVHSYSKALGHTVAWRLIRFNIVQTNVPKYVSGLYSVSTLLLFVGRLIVAG